MTADRKVVLFHRAYGRPPLGAPPGLVTLASPVLPPGSDIVLVSVTAADFESATLTPDETSIEPSVDAFARASGELAFCELVERIAGGHAWDGIRRISFKHGADVHLEMGRPVANLKDLPVPASDPAHFDRFELPRLTRAGLGEQHGLAVCLESPWTGMVSVLHEALG